MSLLQEIRTKKFWKELFFSQFLLFCFIVAIIWGLVWSYPGKKVAQPMIGDNRIVQSINVMLVFVISGMSLQTSDLKSAFANWAAIVYGVIAILAITPCFGFIIIHIPYSVAEFTIGYTIFTCVPTTVNTGILLTALAKGNAAVALLLSAGTNILGAFTTPLFLKAIMSSAKDVEIDSVAIILSLLVTVFAPLLVGYSIRTFIKGVPAWIAANKRLLSMFSAINLAMVVWQTISRSASQIKALSGVSIVLVIISGILIHLFYLLFNFTVMRYIIREKLIPNYEFKPVLLCASQKALPVCVTIIAYLDPAEVGDLGLITVPCVLSHSLQLICDSYIATVLDKKFPNNFNDETELVQLKEENSNDLNNDEDSKFEKQNEVNMNSPTNSDGGIDADIKSNSNKYVAALEDGEITSKFLSIKKMNSKVSSIPDNEHSNQDKQLPEQNILSTSQNTVSAPAASIVGKFRSENINIGKTNPLEDKIPSPKNTFSEVTPKTNKNLNDQKRSPINTDFINKNDTHDRNNTNDYNENTPNPQQPHIEVTLNSKTNQNRSSSLIRESSSGQIIERKTSQRLG